MTRDLAENRSSRRGGVPLKVAIVVAALGVIGILIVDHGPWNKPKVQPAFMPTEPRLQVEPAPPMPKPIHPVNPAPQ